MLKLGMLLMIVALAGFSPLAVVDDCLASGPTVSNGGGADAPVIFDDDSGVGTGGPGCDGCTFHVDVTIGWLHDGNGVLTDPNGNSTTVQVTLGAFTEHSGNYSVPCDSTSTYSAEPQGGGAGDTSTISMECKECK